MSRRSKPRQNPYVMPAIVAGIAAVLLFGGLFYFVSVLPWVISWLLAWGIVTLAVYAFDKQRSKGSGQRIPEMVLHGLAIVGGVVGAWLGVLWVRHKSKHGEFYTVLVIASIVWVAIAGWMLL